MMEKGQGVGGCEERELWEKGCRGNYEKGDSEGWGDYEKRDAGGTMRKGIQRGGGTMRKGMQGEL